MRRLIAIVLVAALLWAGYWWSGATATERAFRGWLDARAAEGWTAAYEEVETRGFPSRFDTTVRTLALGPPSGLWEWRAPIFETLMLSYAPNRAVAAWPGVQRVATPAGTFEFEGDRVIASVRLGVATSVPLEEFRAVAEAFELRADAGWSLTSDRASLATAATLAAPNGQRLGLQLDALRPPAALRALVDPLGAMPDTLDGLHLDADLGFDAPWDRHALEDRAPQLTEIGLRDASFEWGDLALRASGDVVIGADGVPAGRVDVRVENWRRLLDLLRETGVLGPNVAPLTERALEVLAGLSPDDAVIEAPLSFQRGFVSFGPIPLGPAPRLAARS